MAFTYEIVNRFSQFGNTYFDVLVKDGDGNVVHRVEKKILKPMRECTNENFTTLADKAIVEYEAHLEATKPVPVLLDPVNIDPLMDYIEVVNPEIFQQEFKTLIGLFRRNNPGMIEKEFPTVVAYLNTKYPGFIDAFKEGDKGGKK